MMGKRCEHKHRYETRHAAMFFGKVRLQRAYRCPICQGWHLTTQPKRQKAARA